MNASNPFYDPSLNMATLMRALSNPTDLHNPDVVKVVVNIPGDARIFLLSRSFSPWIQGPQRVWAYRHFFLSEVLPDRVFPTAPLAPGAGGEIEQLRALEHGHRIRVTLTGCEDSLLSGFGVDTSEDLDRLEDMLNKRGFH